MKRIVIVAFILFLVVSGCSFVSQNLNKTDVQVEELKYGMTTQEVAAAMGQPQVIKSIAIDGQKHELWEYPIERYWVKKTRPLGRFSYQLLFLDSKLVRWDKIKALSCPSFEYEEPSPGDADVTTIQIFKEKEEYQEAD